MRNTDLPPSPPVPKPWLVVIDMQRIFEPEQQWGIPDYRQAAEKLAQVLPLFEGRTVYTRFVAPDAPMRAWKAYYELYPTALLPAEHPEWDITPELYRPGAPVVSMTTMGKWGPALADIVGDASIVLAGVSTDCCVLTTSIAAADAGMMVHIVEDACAGVTARSHADAIALMALFKPMISITTVAALLHHGVAP